MLKTITDFFVVVVIRDELGWFYEFSKVKWIFVNIAKYDEIEE
jgi:hypothetical protein